MVIGFGKQGMALTLEGGGVTPAGVMVWPRNLMLERPNKHLLGQSMGPWFWSLCRTLWMCLRYSFLDLEKMRMSSV